MSDVKPLLLVDKKVSTYAIRQLRKAGYIVASVDDLASVKTMPSDAALLSQNDLIDISWSIANHTQTLQTSGEHLFKHFALQRIKDNVNNT